MVKKTESEAGFLNEYWRMSMGLVMRKTVIRVKAIVKDPYHPQRRDGFCMTGKGAIWRRTGSSGRPTLAQGTLQGQRSCRGMPRTVLQILLYEALSTACIHSPSRYPGSTSHTPGTIPGTWDTVVDRPIRLPAFLELTFIS